MVLSCCHFIVFTCVLVTEVGLGRSIDLCISVFKMSIIFSVYILLQKKKKLSCDSQQDKCSRSRKQHLGKKFKKSWSLFKTRSRKHELISMHSLHDKSKQTESVLFEFFSLQFWECLVTCMCRYLDTKAGVWHSVM